MTNVRSIRSRKLRVVVLDSAYDSLQDEFSQNIFGKIIAHKLRGYGSVYTYGIMPVDSSDFIATHLCVFSEEQDKLTPLVVYKSVKKAKCEVHNIPFSAQYLAKMSSNENDILAVEKLIKDANERGSLVSYDGGWTIDPVVRQDPALGTELKNLVIAMHYSHYSQFKKYDLFTFAATRFKVDEWFRRWGYSPLSWNGKASEPFPLAAFGGEPVWIHHTQQFSEEARQTAEAYRSYWENRIEIGTMSENLRKILEKKAA